MFSNKFISLHHKARFAIAGCSNAKSTECFTATYLTVLCEKPLPRRYNPVSFVRLINTSSVVPPQITKALEAGSLPSYDTSNVKAVISSIGPIPDAPSPPPPPVPEILPNGEPSLASLGLDSWWPSGLFQKGLEYIHVYVDVPWWTSIVIVTAIVRLVLFPVVVRQLKANIHFANHMPQFAVLQTKMADARAQNDQLSAARYGLELQNFMKEKNLSPFTIMKFAWVQGFVIISFTTGLRAMCALPVESLQTGGCLHVIDLTATDPTYMLPLANALMLFLNLKLGVDIPKTMSQNPRVAMLVQYGFPGFVFITTSFMYNSIGIYWLATAVIALAQNRLIRLPKVRAYLDIPPDAKNKALEQMRAVQDAKKKKLGFIAQVKQGMENSRVANQVKNRSQIDEVAFERAGREPIRKTYKFNPKAVDNKK